MSREIDSRLNGDERAVLFTHYKSEVAKGLDLDRAGLVIPREVKWQLINDVTVQVVDISEHLGIPLPEISLTKGWEEEQEEISEITDVIANASVTDENPYGIIGLSPFYLTKLIKSRTESDQPHPMPLGYVLPHELFHIWQLHENLEQVMKDKDVFKNAGNIAWVQTVTERHAREFGNMWLIKHAMISNFSLNI